MSSISPRSLESADLKASLQYEQAVNWASQQNSVPIIKELCIRNCGSMERRDIRVSLSTDPLFASPVQIRVQVLGPGEEYRQANIPVTLSHQFLSTLHERVNGSLHVQIVEGERDVEATQYPIALLARNEWCGLRGLPELLAAFVLPNEPVIQRILLRASELLGKQTNNSALNGYQDKNKKRVWQQAAAVYRAIVELGIHYVGLPASFEKTGQKVRFPAEVIDDQLGNCLDLSLLFASCLEQVNLRPLVLTHQGHAYAGLWLEERNFPEPCSDDRQQIRKLVADDLITVFESTLVTTGSPGTLDNAETAARKHLTAEEPFCMALDVHRARASMIFPLPLSTDKLEGAPRSALPGPPIDRGIGDRAFPENFEPPQSKASPVRKRIDQWKSRLLDLTGRNRFLNFKETLGAIRLQTFAISELEDALAKGKTFTLRPEPKVMGGEDPRSAELFSAKLKQDALISHLRSELSRGYLHTTLKEEDHGRRLTELFRNARTALEENGANTLFIAIGFLEWRETKTSDKVMRAPILLIPVQLKRKSVLEGFSLQRLDEESRVNVTLLEKMRQDFEKDVPGLDPLPVDEAGIDVTEVLRRVRDAVRDLRGWEVREEAWLAQFSFVKFLLWKDLADRVEDLTRNAVVNHLVNRADQQFDNPEDDISPEKLDDKFRPLDVFCPRSADSSQLAAVMAAAAGQSFILRGPPGTGKSQTITNIIAQCLAISKRVLVVAEKRTALDVVYRRLKEEGLSDFTLELHSNKSGKTEVLAQFERTLQFKDTTDDGAWVQRALQVESLRDELNTYVRALHSRYACGWTAYDCIAHLAARPGATIVNLQIPQGLQLTADVVVKAREAVIALEERARAIVPFADHLLAGIACEEWSPGWEERTQNRLRLCLEETREAEKNMVAVAEWLSLAGPFDWNQVNALYLIAGCLGSMPVVPAALVYNRWADETELTLTGWRNLVAERKLIRGSLEGYDEVKLTALNLEVLQAKANATMTGHPIVRWLKIRLLESQLKKACQPGSKPDCGDGLAERLASAARLRAINQDLAARTAEAQNLLGPIWRGGEPEAEELTQLLRWGGKVHEALGSLSGGDVGAYLKLQAFVGQLVAAGPSLVSATTAAGLRLANFRTSFEKFAASHQAVVKDLNLAEDDLGENPSFLPALQIRLERIIAGWLGIRAWCGWRKARRRAIEADLGAIVTYVERATGEFPSLRETLEASLRRGILFRILEKEPSLRDFLGREHIGRIARFRGLDEELGRLSGKMIRLRMSARLPRDRIQANIPAEEIGLLRKEIAKKTKHMPVRRLLASMPKLFPTLKPCVLMSPLSVAQYLDASHAPFDVVIFDEASQIPVWDAVGAIARGKQLVVVGDPKQLPPTNFFNAAASDNDNGAITEEDRDLESILDELRAVGLREKSLNWHYRSRNEGLIAFSNRQFYKNELLTFPQPDQSSGVALRFISDAKYDRSKSRTNRLEAEALVQELTGRLRGPNQPVRSYGVVTFNLQQQEVIEDLLDRARREHPEIEVHFDPENCPVEGEPVFVKNLENVQGDERDIIIFSICYGPDEVGKILMTFGPLNRDGGERRLNVAVTRAKYELLVFSSIKANQIDLSKTRAKGVQELKYFLDFAERGKQALLAALSVDGDAEPESEFERQVAEAIKAAGYDVHLQVGCSNYRIDVGVLDPDRPGRYLLGVECDGATYHRAATARDRDKLRQLILEGLGWRLHRIWSTDWWANPKAEIQRLCAELKDAVSAASKS